MSEVNPFQPASEVGSARYEPGRQWLRLRRVGVLSAGIFAGAAGVLMGLFAGTFMLLFSLVGFAAQAGAGGGGPRANVPFAAVGVGMMFLAPVFYGIMAFLGGVIYAVLYNVVASMTGGLEIELDRK